MRHETKSCPGPWLNSGVLVSANDSRPRYLPSKGEEKKKTLTGGNQREEKKKKICSEVDWTCEQMLDSCCEKLTQAALCILDGYTTFTPESCRPGSTSAGLLRITSSPKSAPGDITHHLSVNVSREWGLTDTLTHDCYYRLLTILSYCI